MTYTGQFINKKGHLVEITLSAHGGEGIASIGDEDAGLFFTADEAFTMESSQKDTMDHILAKTATVRLLSSKFRPELFARSVFDIEVETKQEGVTVFHGFLTPQTYSQQFAEEYDELELNCLDVLSALEYRNYMDVGGASGMSYDEAKAKASTRTLKDILTRTLSAGRQGMDADWHVWYDGSRAISEDKAARYTIFEDIEVSELLFLGDDEDSVWTSQKVVEEIMRYLGLRLTQEGDDFYVYSWQSVRQMSDTIEWCDLMTGETKTTARRKESLSVDNIEDCGCDISVGECFNVVSLTCSVEKQKSVIENPLSDDDMLRPFGGRQKYMTEYSADGEGTAAYNAFHDIVKGGTTKYEGASVTDWLIEVKQNPQWKFCCQGTDTIQKACPDGKGQQNVANLLALHMGAAIIASGKVERNLNGKDDSVTASVSMEDALVISVNGAKDDTEAGAESLDSSIRAAMPMAEYMGNEAGGVFSPADQEVTNYIVVSGELVLNPLMEMTDRFQTLYDTEWDMSGLHKSWWHQTVPSRQNGDGRYYTRQYFRAASRKDEAQYDEGPYCEDGGTKWLTPGWCPFTDTGAEQYEFKYSAVGDNGDKISKIGVLACQLIIGGKCVVEKPYGEDLGTGTPGTGRGEPQDFVWMPYKEYKDCKTEDEYWQQCFTIGFNPKVGDKLVGKSFKIMDNASYELDIDQEGIAIPIRSADKVSGQVTFRILGPYNLMWDDITRRHPTLFRHTKWTTNTIPLLQHVSSIILKKFEIKVCSDNGRSSVSEADKDLVYMSDTAADFVNKKDDIEFKLTSALSADEAAALGVETGTAMSTPISRLTGTGLLAVYDRHMDTMAKPEQLYVDDVYREYSEPRLQMEVNIQDDGQRFSPFNMLRHEALAKDFYAVGWDRDLMEGSCKLTMKSE